MRRIVLHDTYSGQLQQIKPAVGSHVRIYACGPTVYARIHVGNARPFVVFSLLKRFLVHEGYEVTFVANITDVNDKIYAAAERAGVGSEQLARQMTAAYLADTESLGLGRPDHEPLASETIPEMVELIERLIGLGHAYAESGDVYFSVPSYTDYGALSHRRAEDMDQGEGGFGAGLKRDPRDFALWKAQKPGEDTAWDAPWGRGRPGWHIECSAMAESLLGLDFEIHGGGSDLVFPHHENEIAQTVAARGRPLARVWMHNGMIRLNDGTMSKSTGNIFVLRDALAAYGRDALIMYFCSGHYRQPVDFNDERLRESAAGVARIREVARRVAPGPSPEWSKPLRERFFASLAEDFNTQRAMAAVFDWVREANRSTVAVASDDLREMLEVLALDGLLATATAEPPADVLELREARERARRERDFEAADRLREELRRRGWVVRDGVAGPELVPVA